LICVRQNSANSRNTKQTEPNISVRILSIANCPPLEHLGSGYIISQFCQGLRNNGHDVEFFGPDEYEVLKSFRPRANSHRMAVGMARLLSKSPVQEYDVIEFWGAQAWLALSLLNRRKHSALVVHHTNGPEIRYDPLHRQTKASLYSRLHLALMRKSFTLPQGIVTLNIYDKEWLANAGIDKYVRVEAVEPGLSSEFLQADPGLSRAHTIGYCGSWLPRKGTELIQHDLPLVLREFPDWRLQLIGVGDAFDKRHHFPADVLPQIDVLPFVFQKSELISLYQNLSIIIFPSKPESFGMVLAEAMACGCAAIATKVGFSASLHNGAEILHLNNHAPGALRDQLRTAILDDDLRTRIAAAGARRAKQLAWPRAIEHYERLLQSWRQAATIVAPSTPVLQSTAPSIN
jgi:glycosyltransferase involved in cell wall biosynthesis